MSGGDFQTLYGFEREGSPPAFDRSLGTVSFNDAIPRTRLSSWQTSPVSNLERVQRPPRA
jgi:hypothetical protein